MLQLFIIALVFFLWLHFSTGLLFGGAKTFLRLNNAADQIGKDIGRKSAMVIVNTCRKIFGRK